VTARVRAWLAFGPGLVFALTVIGPADVISNAAAGAEYGYSLLWALVISLVFRFVWASTSAKYVLATGDSLLQGYARIGTWAVWLVLISLVVHRHASNLYLITILGASADFLVPLPTPHSRAVWGLAGVALAFVVLFWGKYGTVEKVFKGIAVLLSLTFVTAAVLSKPDVGAALRSLLMPTLPGAAGLYGAFFVLMALIGTGSGSLTNLNYSYFIYRKGWRSDGYLNRQRVDLLLSLACMFALCALVQLAAAGTLRPVGAQLKSVDDLSRILSQTGGRLGGIAFAFGLGAVAFSVFVGATTGFALIVTDICRNLLPVFRGTPAGESGNRHPERDIVYRGSVLFSVLSPLYILFIAVRPVWLVLFVSSLTFALAPLLAAGLLWMTNDRGRLGRHTNGWLTNVVLAALIVTSLLLACKNAYDVLASR